jgi:hypothetical protein
MDVMGQNPLQKMMLVVLVIYLYPGSMQEYEEPPGEMNSSKFPPLKIFSSSFFREGACMQQVVINGGLLLENNHLFTFQ